MWQIKPAFIARIQWLVPLVALFLSLPVAATDLLVSRDFHYANLDKQSQRIIAPSTMPLDMVIEQRFTLPKSHSVFPLNDNEVLWQIIEIHSIADTNSDMVLSVGRLSLDSVSVFIVNGISDDIQQITVREEDTSSLRSQGALNIPITLGAGSATTLAVAIADKGFRQVPIYLWERSSLETRESRNLLLFGLAIGSLTVLLLYFFLTYLYSQTKCRLWLSLTAMCGLFTLVWAQGDLAVLTGLYSYAESVFTLLALTQSFLLIKLTQSFFVRIPGWLLYLKFAALALCCGVFLQTSPFYTFLLGVIVLAVFTSVCAMEAIIYRDRRAPSLTILFTVAWACFTATFINSYRELAGGISHLDVAPTFEIFLVICVFLLLGIAAEIKEQTISNEQISSQRRRITDLQHFYDLFRSSAEGMFTSTIDGKLKSVNPAMCSVFGYADEASMLSQLSNSASFYLDENERRELTSEVLEKGVVLGRETQGVRKDGSKFWFSLSCQLKQERDSSFLYGSVFDITAKKEMDLSMQYMASHDPLTGAMNRREFERQLSKAMQNITVSRTPVILQYLDLDRFKTVNDSCGHKAGDKLIKELASLLKSAIGDRGCLARLGGDEFAALYTDETEESAYLLGMKMLNAVQNYRFVWDNRVFHLGVSIGMVNSDHFNTTADHLLSMADNACYMAKKRGRNCIHRFSGDEEELKRYDHELTWVNKIQQALRDGTFQLYYQPIQPLGQQEAGSYIEILLRMTGENGEIIEPMAFLPTAERHDLSLDIDEWVVTHTLRWLGQHPTQLADLAQCNINLSGKSLAQKKLKLQLLNAFEQHNVPYSKICFEITETSAIVHMDEALEFIQTFKQLGCKFALDDFGTGFSSYAYLKTLPVNLVKIDGNFVRDMQESKVDKVMVSSINEVAKAIGMKTVGEYVESTAALQALKSMGVDFAQGFAIARPAPLDAFQTLRHS